MFQGILDGVLRDIRNAAAATKIFRKNFFDVHSVLLNNFFQRPLSKPKKNSTPPTFDYHPHPPSQEANLVEEVEDSPDFWSGPVQSYNSPVEHRFLIGPDWSNNGPLPDCERKYVSVRTMPPGSPTYWSDLPFLRLLTHLLIKS